MKVIGISALFFVYSFALYGWGRLGERIVRARWPWPATICFGLAIWVVLGGVLNLLGIARGVVLDGIVLLGLVGACVALWPSARRVSLESLRQRYGSMNFAVRTYPAGALIVAVFVFTAITQVPPQAFNFRDDLEKYLVHPLRMLATGTLDGGPFSALGSETLGGQAYIHGFVAAHWSIGHVNAVDALFGLVLSMTIVLVAADRARLRVWLVPLAVAALFFISPQYVNASVSYVAVALLLFLVFIPYGNRVGPGIFFATPSAAVVVGLMYAALVALKSTYLLIPLAHFPLSVAAVAFATRGMRTTLAWCVTVAVAAMVGILPWMLIHAPRWYAAWAALGPSVTATAEGNHLESPLPPLDLFSLKPLFLGLGASFAHYTVAVLFVCLCCALIVYRARRHAWSENPSILWSLSGCAMLPILYLVTLLTLGRYLTGYDTALRYMCPILIALVPAAIILAGETLPGVPHREGEQNLSSLVALMAISLPTFLLLGAFYGPLVNRIEQAANHGSILSFPAARAPIYLNYSRFAMSDEAKGAVSEVQHLVPEGETLVAWISLPLHLDYRRNRIFNVEPAGLGSPAQDFPFDGDAEAGEEYFRRHGVRYVLWQHSGTGIRSVERLLVETSSPFAYVRRDGRNALVFNRMLFGLSQRSQILHEDETFLLFQLP